MEKIIARYTSVIEPSEKYSVVKSGHHFLIKTIEKNPIQIGEKIKEQSKAMAFARSLCGLG